MYIWPSQTDGLISTTQKQYFLVLAYLQAADACTFLDIWNTKHGMTHSQKIPSCRPAWHRKLRPVGRPWLSSYKYQSPPTLWSQHKPQTISHLADTSETTKAPQLYFHYFELSKEEHTHGVSCLTPCCIALGVNKLSCYRIWPKPSPGLLRYVVDKMSKGIYP